jgi:hypothetical protein
MKRFSIGLILLAAACRHRVLDIPRGAGDENLMQTAVVRGIGIGAPIEEARYKMQRSGFQCVPKKNAAWGNRTGIDYLYCERRETSGVPVKQLWRIALVEQDGAVTEVLVASSPIAP